MNFKCPHCQKAIEIKVTGRELKSIDEVFAQAFGGGSAGKKEAPLTLNDEMKALLAMEPGDVIEWGGGMLTRKSDNVFEYSHPDIDGGTQLFSKHVDLRMMAKKYPAVKDYFIEKIGYRMLWGGEYDWVPPSGRGSNGLTGFTNRDIRDGIVSCTDAGYQGRKKE